MTPRELSVGSTADEIAAALELALGFADGSVGTEDRGSRISLTLTQARALLDRRSPSAGDLDMDLLWLRTILIDYRKRAIPVAQREEYDARSESILGQLEAAS